MTPAQFNALPQPKRAVLLAKDVILQVRLKHCIPTFGTYLEPDRGVEYDKHDKLPATKARLKALNCEVCALGAAFLSHVRLANKATMFGVRMAGPGEMRERMNKTIGIEQSLLIETAFEGYISKLGKGNWQAGRFGREHDDPDRRLVAIMLNVIQNKGEFIPSIRISGRQVTTALKSAKGT